MPGDPVRSVESRSSTTVDACRGSAGVVAPLASARTWSTISRGSRPSESPYDACVMSADLDDDLDLDRGIEGEHGDTDRAAGVPSGVTEHLAEQLARAVHDGGLTGERRCARDETDDL